MHVRLQPPSSWIHVSDGIYSVGAGYVVLGAIDVAPTDLDAWLRDTLASGLPAGTSIEHDGMNRARVVSHGEVVEERCVECLRFGGLAAAALVIGGAELATEIADTLAAARLPPASLSQLLAGFNEED